MGKMIGGGFPVGALAGRAEVMDVMNPLADKVLFPHSGTFSANPVTMTAGLLSMQLFDRDAVERLNALGDYARRRIQEVIKLADVPACVTGDGSMFRLHMKVRIPENYRATYSTPVEARRTKQLLDHLFNHGIMMINTCTGSLSTAMDKGHVDAFCEVLLSGFRQIQDEAL